MRDGVSDRFRAPKLIALSFVFSAFIIFSLIFLHSSYFAQPKKVLRFLWSRHRPGLFSAVWKCFDHAYCDVQAHPHAPCDTDIANSQNGSPVALASVTSLVTSPTRHQRSSSSESAPALLTGSKAASCPDPVAVRRVDDHQLWRAVSSPLTNWTRIESMHVGVVQIET
jgi:hypothetical protein